MPPRSPANTQTSPPTPFAWRPAIADPYKRADAIWEALQRVRCAADRLRGRRADVCNDIARYLEGGCEGRDEPPGGETLEGYARTLDGI